jgi:hypothetical protein
MDDADPGWPRLPNLLLLFVPQIGIRRVMQSGDALLGLRAVMLSFTLAIVAFGIVLGFLDLPNGPVQPWVIVLAGIALVSTVGDRLVERPLDTTSEASLAQTYRSRFFLRIAFAEAVALFGFVFSFIGGPRWIYYPAAVFTLVVFWTRIAPTRGALAREQSQLRAFGCRWSLVTALRNMPTPPSS